MFSGTLGIAGYFACVNGQFGSTSDLTNSENVGPGLDKNCL